MNKYDIDLDLSNRNSLSVLIQHIKKNSTILEFGPANGRLTKYLKNELNCTIYAVEIDENAASSLEQYCEKLIIGNIETYEWQEDFKGIEFDSIIFADVLEHLYNPQEVLTSTKEFLKDDGNILVSLPNIAHNAVIMDLLKNKFTYSKTGLLDDTHIRFFTNSSFLELIKKCDLHCHYESGVYARANETEFHYDYADFEMGDTLEKRELGEVYQFLYELKETPCKEKISDFNSIYLQEKVLSIAKLYVDTGNGYNEDDSIEIKNPQTRQTIEFDISKFKSIKSLRFDPLDRVVSIAIDNINISFKDNTSQKIEFTCNNSFFNNLNIDYFLHTDSRYIYEVDEQMSENIKKIVIDCKIIDFGDSVIDEAKEIHANQQNELNMINNELNMIKNSRGYKFILSLRKLRRFLHV